jgi:uncharacterized protein (TIGR02145 family)
MRKSFLIALLSFSFLFGCGGGDDMPCFDCMDFPQQYPYTPSSSSWQGSQGSYAYCLYYYGESGYGCSYMSVSACNGTNYGSDNTCGGWANPVQPSSSSSRPGSSSSSGEYVGGSCNIADYGAVNIGGQVWMQKNWGCYASGSKCYGNDPANCARYGRLYDWSTAMGINSRYNSEEWGGSDVNHRGVCPSGWHIPSYGEWEALSTYIESDMGCSYCDARHLKATSGWNSGGNGEDSYGFSALPGGLGFSGGNFYDAGSFGSWWSATEGNSIYAYYRDMGYGIESADWYYDSKNYLFSVRCLQD